MQQDPSGGWRMFEDRAEAGRLLARELQARALADPVVIALPRGGVPVALEVARALHAPLDLLLVRKIGAPWQPELAVAAVAEGEPPALVLHERNMLLSGADRDYVEHEAQVQRREIERRRAAYLGGRPRPSVEGRTAVLVDDGIATGTTVQAALRALRQRRPARRVLAVPVASREALGLLGPEVDELVCLASPAFFGAVGAYYRDFHQVEDGEVIAALQASGPAPGH